MHKTVCGTSALKAVGTSKCLVFSFLFDGNRFNIKGFKPRKKITERNGVKNEGGGKGRKRKQMKMKKKIIKDKQEEQDDKGKKEHENK